MYPGSSAPHGFDTPQSGAVAEQPQQGQGVAAMAAVVPSPLEPTMPVEQKARGIPRISAALLIGLVVVIIAGGVLGSVSLLVHFGVIGAHSSANASRIVRGGTWTYGLPGDANSLIPNGANDTTSALMDQVLYLPLFYGDALASSTLRQRQRCPPCRMGV